MPMTISDIFAHLSLQIASEKAGAGKPSCIGFLMANIPFPFWAFFGKHHLKDQKIAAQGKEINQFLCKNVSKNPSFSHKITLGIPLIC